MRAVKVVELKDNRIVMTVQRSWLFGLWYTDTQYLGEDKYNSIDSFKVWRYLETHEEVDAPWIDPFGHELNSMYKSYLVKQELLELQGESE